MLSILANVAANARVAMNENKPTPELLQRFQASFERLEEEAEALSPDVFKGDVLRDNQQIFHVAFLSGWGLRLAHRVVDSSALEVFLTLRYGLRSDDCEHSDIFGWGGVR